MRVSFVDLKAEYEVIKEEIDTAIAVSLERTDFVLGQAVQDFEDAFAKYCGAAYAIGVDSGFSALELALRAYGIGPGDEVITAANTFIATVLAISNCGAHPVLVDIAPETYNLDPAQLEQAITPRTRAIIPVHLYGHPANMSPIMAIAQNYGLKVIEDACQAHGAQYKGRRIGSVGDAAAFSFYPSKNLGAYGDGGAIVTNDKYLADQVRLLRNLGQKIRYHHEIKGFNHRLDTLQAAILKIKLNRLDQQNTKRRLVAALYNELLAGTPVVTPYTADWAEPAYHLYVIRTANRDALQQHLSAAGIASGLHYPIPIHLQPAYGELGHQEGDFPIAEAYAKEILSLPMYPELEPEAVRYTVDSIKAFITESEVRQPAMALMP